MHSIRWLFPSTGAPARGKPRSRSKVLVCFSSAPFHSIILTCLLVQTYVYSIPAFSGYSLSLPALESPSYAKALTLWSPPPTSRLFDTSIRSISPIRGNTLTALDLASHRGVLAKVHSVTDPKQLRKHDYEVGWREAERARSSYSRRCGQTARLCESLPSPHLSVIST
jgi:hypothetical protein